MQSFAFYQSPVLCALLLFHSCTCVVGLTTSSVSAATHSTLHQRTSQAISQQYNHQETELGQQLQQLQFSQCQQRTGAYICTVLTRNNTSFDYKPILLFAKICAEV